MKSLFQRVLILKRLQEPMRSAIALAVPGKEGFALQEWQLQHRWERQLRDQHGAACSVILC